MKLNKPVLSIIKGIIHSVYKFYDEAMKIMKIKKEFEQNQLYNQIR